MMNRARKGDAPDMRSEASSANNFLCGVISMSSLAHLSHKKQFRCLPIGKHGAFQYVEIITSVDLFGNYQIKQQLVDGKELKTSWADFYYQSGSEVNEQ